MLALFYWLHRYRHLPEPVSPTGLWISIIGFFRRMNIASFSAL